MTATATATAAAKPVVTKKAEPLVTVRALTPFGGGYDCPMEEADRVTTREITGPDGYAMKRTIGIKRYAGLVGHVRHATSIERDHLKPYIAKLSRQLPQGTNVAAYIEGVCAEALRETGIDFTGVNSAGVPTVRQPGVDAVVPESIARDLVARGLGEIVGKAVTP